MGNVIMSGIVPLLEKPVGGTPIADVAVGSIVKLNESGSPVEFYVAKHNYESGLNGAGRTLLVRKDCYEKIAWHSSNVNAYAVSTIDSWLNGDYKALLDSDVQEAVRGTEFYYTVGNNDTSVAELNRDVFLLSVTELGKSASYANVEGVTLSIANLLQVAYLNGSALAQWTRTPNINSAGNAYCLGTTGSATNYGCTSKYGVRPCFTLPATAKVQDDGTIIV